LISLGVKKQIEVHEVVPDDASSNTDAEASLIPSFADIMIIIPYPEVTVAEVERTLTRKTRWKRMCAR
jgi:hypothetical protein